MVEIEKFDVNLVMLSNISKFNHPHLIKTEWNEYIRDKTKK